ncbi:hypothetical protein D4764_0192080 [Takifugu flavidus]|uniref:RNase H type-1 domain-containing protein n=1 Tax=Takifugu flavidus TaxID=433684 RepID=A0A5C6MHS7_9TELE|nr:hypothetical protein D4764_0192080 [Takifugu flavidus]
MGTLQSKDSWKSDAGPSASLETTYPLPYQPGTTATIGLTRKRASRDADTGRCKAGYAVCDSRGTVESASLPSNYLAQAAELVALTRACHLAANQSVTIFTDSRYAFGVVHDFGALWKHRGFLKSDGAPILNHRLVAALLDAVLLPSQVAICKWTAHTNLSDPISAGNARADEAAKTAAALPSTPSTLCAVTVPSSLSAIQSLATQKDKQLWRQVGAVHTQHGWMGPNGKPCLPSALFHHYAKLTHGIPNVGITPPQATLPDTTLCESSVLTYCRNLTKSLSEIRARVKAADQQLHPLHPGDYVVIKDFRRTRWNQKRWQGPFQILLVTQTAVKVAERATWIHASHCKKVPEPKEPVSRE